MASPNIKLADSLKVLKELQAKNGSTIKTSEITRTHRERLLKNGFIKEVIKGWYIIVRPDTRSGDSTTWYSSFWIFCSRFLEDRYKNEWCISPEQSITIQSGDFTVPKQLQIRSPKANNTLTQLPNDTSIFNSKLSIPKKEEIEFKEGLRVQSLPSALVNCSQSFFQQNSVVARIALALIKDSSQILTLLLPEGRSVVAGRLAGAFRNIGKDKIADDIVDAMKAAGNEIREIDPFNSKLEYNFDSRDLSPYVMRINQMWEMMRQKVIDIFPKAIGIPENSNKYLEEVQEVFTTDAYHSLSIEGYQVTAELIERVENGTWNPDINEKDKEFQNAMAAKGYSLAFKSVKESIKKILNGENSGKVINLDHGKWYRELFSPSVTSGLLEASALAGYRTDPVYIKNSLHVPMSQQAVRDAMPAFLNLLELEQEPSVRVVLGHFVFVYIHPYLDGNGRMGRFLMNAMLASGGYPWTVVPVEERKKYLDALEEASVNGNIEPFAKYLAYLVNAGLSGKPIAKKEKAS